MSVQSDGCKVELKDSRVKQKTFAIINGKNRNCKTCKNLSEYKEGNQLKLKLICTLDNDKEISEKLVCPKWE